MTAAQTLLARIKDEGSVNGQVIKVDRFLNHMVDPQLMEILGADIASRFQDQQIDKILTAETSGIMLAQAVAGQLKVPFVYAKKKCPVTMGEYYAAASYSFTKEESTTLYVSKEVMGAGDRLLFIDDFFAKGSTYKAIVELINQAKAILVGSGVIINKGEHDDIEAILTLKDLQAL
jgi:xanthine phosphoribosyltransferase